METVVRKWGNSLGIRVPNYFVRKLSLNDGSRLSINSNGNEIIIKPVQKTQNLAEMLSKINRQNQHEEIAVSGPAGKEVW